MKSIAVELSESMIAKRQPLRADLSPQESRRMQIAEEVLSPKELIVLTELLNRREDAKTLVPRGYDPKSMDQRIEKFFQRAEANYLVKELEEQMRPDPASL